MFFLVTSISSAKTTTASATTTTTSTSTTSTSSTGPQSPASLTTTPTQPPLVEVTQTTTAELTFVTTRTQISLLDDDYQSTSATSKTTTMSSLPAFSSTSSMQPIFDIKDDEVMVVHQSDSDEQHGSIITKNIQDNGRVGVQPAHGNPARNSNETFTTVRGASTPWWKWDRSTAQWATIVALVLVLAFLQAIAILLDCKKRRQGGQFLCDQEPEVHNTQHASSTPLPHQTTFGPNRGPVGPAIVMPQIRRRDEQSGQAASSSPILVAQSKFRSFKGDWNESESSFHPELARRSTTQGERCFLRQQFAEVPASFTPATVRRIPRAPTTVDVENFLGPVRNQQQQQQRSDVNAIHIELGEFESGGDQTRL